MSEFVASNGIRVRVEKAFGDLEMIGAGGPHRSWEFVVNSAGVEALREFFLAERDVELGRWRSKEHPECVVLVNCQKQATVVSEKTGAMSRPFGRGEFPGTYGEFANIAAEFFAAHPEPKPWHDAQPGEVWVLTISGETLAHEVGADGRFKKVGGILSTPLRFPAITAGRRIWPEV